MAQMASLRTIDVSDMMDSASLNLNTARIMHMTSCCVAKIDTAERKNRNHLGTGNFAGSIAASLFGLIKTSAIISGMPNSPFIASNPIAFV